MMLVFDPVRGWLDRDKKTWTDDFYAAREFKNESIARNVALSMSKKKEEVFFILSLIDAK